MITEDYVSFETAKLLKEKGFREWCSYCYGLDVRYKGESIDQDEEFELKEEGKEGELEYVEGGRLYNFGCDNREEGSPYSAPSLYVAIKWLREKFNIHIEPRYFPTPNIYRYVIIHSPMTIQNIDSHPQYFNSYEEACEAAIKYCLENLI